MKKFEKIEKIGYHSNFDFECNTERDFLKESLSIAGLLDLNTREGHFWSVVPVLLNSVPPNQIKDGS